jgi:hypothetical protein
VALLVALIVGSLVSLVLVPGTAVAQQPGVPTLPAVAGQPFSATGVSTQLLDGTCTNLRDVYINWRDGGPTSPPNSATLVGETVVVGDNPLPFFRVSVTVSHVFAFAGLFDPRVNYYVTCTNANDEEYDFHGTDDPIFNVVVAPGGGGPGTGPSCPGQTTSSLRISQESCPYNTYYGSYEKDLFRVLAKAYYRGYLQNKALDDIVSKWTGETWITENIVGNGNILKEFVIGKFWGKIAVDKAVARLDDVIAKVAKGRLPKLGPYAWILDTPKYASYLDYVKYLVLTKLADDPPDPNFTALASPPKLRSLRGAPRQVGERDRREAGLYIALLTTVERAAGAQAAGATAAQSAQLRHASDIANQLVSLLGAKQKALKAAARAVKRIHAGRLPRRVVRRAKRRLDSRSLTPALRKLGFTRDEIAAGRQSAPSVPLKRLTAPFEQVLGLGAQARTVGAVRAALASFAKRHAPGG